MSATIIKRMMAFILVILCLLILNSCHSDKPYEPITGSILEDGEMGTGNIAGDYLYRSIKIDEQTLLLKYNIHTGSVSTVCQDPFCDHKEGCPFWIESGDMACIGNTLYYIFDNEGNFTIRSYNGDSMTLSDVMKSKLRISHLFAYNQYLFYTEIEQISDGCYQKTFHRYDTETKEKQTILQTEKSISIDEIKNQTITWKNANSYYITDLDGNGETSTPSEGNQWGYYSYRSELDVTGQITWENFKRKLYRTDKRTGVETFIADGVGPTFFYGDKILYFTSVPSDEKKVIMNTPEGTYYDYFGGNVYVMNLDGSDNHLLSHAENCYISGMSPDRNNELVSGDWVGIILKNYYPDKTGVLTFTDTDLLIVNVVTGEYTVARYNPFDA